LFAAMFGARSGTILATAIAQPSHTFSYQHAMLAESDGEVLGFCQGWPYGTPAGDSALMRAAGVRAVRAAAIGILGRPVLSAIDRHAPGEWYLQAIAVSAAARGKGVGQMLFADAFARAGAARCEALTLDVDAVNVRAIDLYQRLGLTVVATTPRARFLGGAQVHRMSAPLAAPSAG
jgi:ribosomal protein S18 acetylase RimI-like enzyme